MITNILIPMAGAGSRFSKAGINTPKPLIEVDGKCLIEHAVKSLDYPGDVNYIFVTREYEDPKYNLQLTNIFQSLNIQYTEIKIKNITSGASETCLAARALLDNDKPLIITNCDQLLHWDSKKFVEFLDNAEADGCVVCYKSTDPKNSFAELDAASGNITVIKEKTPISDNALIGLHWWRAGKDFVASAENLLRSFHSTGQPESYISETYNWLIASGRKIVPYFIGNNNYISLGTPQDVAIFLGKLKEYHTPKPKTIFCDIDGTIMKHMHRYSDLSLATASLLQGVSEKFNEWDTKGYCIVLVTARKESSRKLTTEQLEKLGIPYDHLLMGITSGIRILINDKLNVEDIDRAQAVNTLTDQSWQNISWKDHGI
jgi:dTDP-glucose pyrophosphorylase